ncbi:MAG TPA: deoxyribonuclease V [Syntrophales bacterium]|nr:deoxyribonuclease V [Syntrophales bacterium]HPX10785.1 deoxyribonuclease V [Syntrophales bacterium]HQN77365.1 deoxyribonuclease V [Syntrophales bacterium]HQQ26705.1 deoxyribonuclease V [Syntrophales bacterium]
MKISRVHSWDVDYREAVRIQEALRRDLVVREDRFPERIGTIAGADVSFLGRNPLFHAAVTVLDFPSLDILEVAVHSETVSFPYIPGLLTFREGPPLLGAFGKLRTVPDVVIFDGQGIAHPRGLGLASHMGVLLGIPSIGCGKTRLVGEHGEPGEGKGSAVPLLYEGNPVGAVVRTRRGVKPVFVSPGHDMGFERAVEIVLACCRSFRLPEPVRRAHDAVNRARKGLPVTPC